MTTWVKRSSSRLVPSKVFAAGFVVLILLAGTGYTLATQGSAPLLQPTYLLQQLQVGSFLGIVAAGLMIVILLGHIDLSVPWTLTAAAGASGTPSPTLPAKSLTARSVTWPSTTTTATPTTSPCSRVWA